MRIAFLAVALGLAANAASLHAQTPAPAQDLDALLTTYNALPDTAEKLAIGESGALPLWVRDLALTRQEQAALVALAGAYTPQAESASDAPQRRKRHPLEYVAGLAVAAKTQDALRRANYAGATGVCCALANGISAGPKRQKIIARPPVERFIRLVSALESCPGAFASLALKLREAHAGSALDAMARRARTDDLAFAVKPDAACRNL